MTQFVEEIFVTEGIPRFTFVKPPNYNDILLDIRNLGKPVIIEGQSGTGKTTCVRKIIEQLGGLQPEILTARSAVDVHRIETIAQGGVYGRFVIDDFHRLAQETRVRLADMAKMAAEGQFGNELKLIFIGINQVGSALIQLVPDIAKRTGIHRVEPGSEQEIARLISDGCEKLNITISNSDMIYHESRGDYWLTQQLCQTACTINDVLQTQEHHKEVLFEIETIRRKVTERLSAAFYPSVKEFCRGVRFRPNNDPYLKLLQKIGQQSSSVVDLNELANANLDVQGSINNIKEKRLSILLRDKPNCARHFHYNSETKNFAIEDPALFYFIKHLDWTRIRNDCGFRTTGRDYEYDFAISFAGENRDLARTIVEQLLMYDTSVFFDEHFEANFLGRAWSAQFERIFSHDSRLVVCILDSHYREKIWPTFERECFLPRVTDAEVIPIFLDETVFVGIPKDIVGIKYKKMEDNDQEYNNISDNIVFKLLERVGLLN